MGVAAIVCDTTGNTVRQGYCYTCLAIGGGYFGRVTKDEVFQGHWPIQIFPEKTAPRDWSIRISPAIYIDQWLPNVSESSGLHRHRSIECSSLFSPQMVGVKKFGTNFLGGIWRELSEFRSAFVKSPSFSSNTKFGAEISEVSLLKQSSRLDGLQDISEHPPAQVAEDLLEAPAGLSLRHLSRRLTRSIHSKAVSDLWRRRAELPETLLTATAAIVSGYMVCPANGKLLC